ncbi:sel1 repeat family protein [Pseudomonas sp. B21-028]|uniref:tetratricopeptide repeat protein n=1 Tax=Pseudomonas sp. B21-028 TaxID=2895480 RepID=UPI00215E207A|nr:tetratricopeptide repeat protein [Pseudomonas sp. B21-028]UVL84688.1 sel1 repeat family protein [Pseudomonas sp. B21-028]
MTRNIAAIGLTVLLGGCQSLEGLGERTVGYLKATRTTPMERYLTKTHNPDVPLGSFGYPQEDSQGEACYFTRYYKTVPPARLQFVMVASDGGNAICQHVLGTFYESGNGVPRDPIKAKALYQQAAPTDPYAYVELGRMARDGIDEPVDAVKARDYYSRAGVAGVVELGKLMERGEGGVQDLPGALKLYIDATQKYGDPAWKAARLLLVRGMELDAEQMQKYNQLWARGLADVQHSKLRFSRAVRELRQAGQTWTVKVLYRFSTGRPNPEVYLAKSCGDPNVDTIVVSALRDVAMKDPYLTPVDQETLDFMAPIVLFPR